MMIAELKKLTAHPEDLRRVPKVLAEFGIRLVLIEHLPKTRIDGAALWLDAVSPVVALSLRYDRIDSFWHTLIHELVHVRDRDDPVVDSDMTSTESELPPVEIKANAEACNYLIPIEKLDSFVARQKPLYYQTKVVQFAQARGVHPGIVVGQLQRRGELDWQQLRKLLAKMRHEIIGQALTDGWGNLPRL
jgi:HTH-type transcriptional regulator/antitoxin HigA